MGKADLVLGALLNIQDINSNELCEPDESPNETTLTR